MRQSNVDGNARTVGKKAGRKPAFTEADVVTAALDEGIDSFTLSAVAQRLGVVTPAIYRLFDSREQVVVACLDRAAASIRLPADEPDWHAVLKLWADECWRVCENFPGLERVVYDYAPAFTRIEEILAEYSRRITAYGKTPGQAMFALDFIGDTVFACHLSVESMRTVDDSGTTGLDRVKAAVSTHSVIEPRESWRERGVVDLKVDFILMGLEHRLPEI